MVAEVEVVVGVVGVVEDEVDVVVGVVLEELVEDVLSGVVDVVVLEVVWQSLVASWATVLAP